MKFGKAFSDSITVGQSMRHRDRGDKTAWWLGSGRALLFASILIVCFFVLSFRLFDLTVIQGHKFRALSDGNRTRELIRHAPRGLFLDRTGRPLVVNEPNFRLIHPCQSNSAISCTEHLRKDEGEALQTKGLPAGTYLEVDYERRYPVGSALAHVLGYTGEITEEELQDNYYTLRNYQRGDRVGRMGAEAIFEEAVRGRDGKELVEVDATGKILRSLGVDRETAGENITLSLDSTLSEVSEKAFPAGKKGAVIVTKPQTGEVLVLYSSPSFNPTSFSLGLSQLQYNALLNNPDRPMFDRVIGGVYPPGSTFKIPMAIAALEEKAITKDTVVEDVGVLTIGTQFRFPNWYFQKYGKTDGMVDIVKGLQRSNDIFFYKVGEMLGITKLAGWAKRLGLGKPLGIELSGEAGGLMPDPAWKRDHFATPQDKEARNDEWYVGDTYHVSIGQGYLLTTPLQVNAWTNVIANGGTLCKPTIVKPQTPNHKLQTCKDLGIKKETVALITEGMRKACETGGTGWPLFGFSVIPAQAGIQSSISPTGSPVGAGDDNKKVTIPIACKTGTAEFGDPANKTHAWFTAYAPVRPPSETRDSSGQAPSSDAQNVISGEPEISVTVLVEEGGEGSDVAAPIAKKILEAWFGR